MQKFVAKSLGNATSGCRLLTSAKASSKLVVLSQRYNSSAAQGAIPQENQNEISTFNTSISKVATEPKQDVPANVKAIYYQPLRNPVQYGDLVCDLQLRAYDNENLDFFSDFILRAGFYLGAALTGPKPLPTKRERWTVIKAPFVFAKTKENFERRTHKRLIRVWDTNPEVVDLLMSYITKHSITGVGLKVNFYQKQGLDLNFEQEFQKLENTIGTEQAYQDLDEKNDHISKRVGEILNDPVFKQYMKPEDKPSVKE